MFIFKKGAKYIGIAEASMGYPYATDDPMKAQQWGSVEIARRYASQFKESWTLHELHGLEVTPVLDEPKLVNDMPTARITREEAEKWVQQYWNNLHLSIGTDKLVTKLLDQIYGE